MGRFSINNLQTSVERIEKKLLLEKFQKKLLHSKKEDHENAQRDFEERKPDTMKKSVVLISGCEDRKTSTMSNIDMFTLPDSAGRCGGIVTAALLNVLYWNDDKQKLDEVKQQIQTRTNEIEKSNQDTSERAASYRKVAEDTLPLLQLLVNDGGNLVDRMEEIIKPTEDEDDTEEDVQEMRKQMDYILSYDLFVNLDKAKKIIYKAFNTSSPLFVSGNIAGCAQIYREAAEKNILPLLPSNDDLQNKLQEVIASKYDDPAEETRAFREQFDHILSYNEWTDSDKKFEEALDNAKQCIVEAIDNGATYLDDEDYDSIASIHRKSAEEKILPLLSLNSDLQSRLESVIATEYSDTCVEAAAFLEPFNYILDWTENKEKKLKCMSKNNCSKEEAQHLTYVDVIDKLRSSIKNSGHDQKPQLTSLTLIDINTEFKLVPDNFKGKRRAVMVGISYDGGLIGCHNDVINMKKYLIERCDFKEYYVDVLMDDGVHTLPTKSNIMNALLRVVNDCNDGDAVFFFFSGHGTEIVDENGDEKDGYDECLVPCDYLEYENFKDGVISDDDLFDNIISELPSDVHMVALMDCCHSGTIRFALHTQGKRGW
mmetsp:Transcript_54009/g.60323  ORF Transcript_54009/g.60323 Transcript_54009/m.60323 type:complete len:598 (-) Transcript_54009:227-2020(-)